MKKETLNKWSKDFKEGAVDAVTDNGTYIAAAIGGTLRTIATRKIGKGIYYGLFAVGAQVVWNGACRIAINSYFGQ